VTKFCSENCDNMAHATSCVENRAVMTWPKPRDDVAVSVRAATIKLEPCAHIYTFLLHQSASRVYNRGRFNVERAVAEPPNHAIVVVHWQFRPYSR
jgi:hypothetical protein